MYRLMVLFFIFIHVRCSFIKTVPEKEPVFQEKDYFIRDQSLLNFFSHYMKKKKCSPINSPAIEKIVHSLVKSELLVPIQVFSCVSEEKKWESISFPGNQIYLSQDLLLKLKKENEWASLLAKEISHLNKKHFAYFLEKKTNNFFNFSIDFEKEALKDSVFLLYENNYDPRGVFALESIYHQFPDFCPYPFEWIKEIFEETHQIELALKPLFEPRQDTLIFKKFIEKFQKNLAFFSNYSSYTKD